MRSELAFCHHTPNFNPPLSKKVRLWSQLLRARFVRREPGLGAVLSPGFLGPASWDDARAIVEVGSQNLPPTALLRKKSLFRARFHLKSVF